MITVHELAGDELFADNLAEYLGLGITHSSKYRRFLAELLDCQDVSLEVRADGVPMGFMPLMRKDGPYGPVYNSLPFAGSDGGIVIPIPAPPLWNAMVHGYEERTSDALTRTVIPSPLLFQPDPRGTRPIPYMVAAETTGQFTKLRDELWPRLEQRAQTAIRRAERNAVHVCLRDDWPAWDWLRETHQETMRGLGVQPKSNDFFELAAAHFTADERLCFIAAIGNQPVAGALLFRFGTTVDYFLTANTDRGRDAQAMSALVYHALTWGQANGVRLWNWGSYTTGQEGVARFKRQWDAFELAYYYYTDLPTSAVLQRTPAELADGYPGFFVYPYRLLEEAAWTPPVTS